MKNLIILIGNIGTGKTTFIKTQNLIEKGYVVIARDRLRYNIGGGNYIFNTKYEAIIWKTELFMFENFLKLGTNIVIDEVGVSKSLRKRYIPLAKKYKYQIVAIEMPKLTKEMAVNRRMQNPHQQNDRKLWEEIWEKFDAQYESPEYSEGFEHILKLV